MNCGAILALPFLLREDSAFLFDDREITNVPPQIWADVLDMNKNVIYEKLFQKDARFKIYIEKVSIAKCKILWKQLQFWLLHVTYLMLLSRKNYIALIVLYRNTYWKYRTIQTVQQKFWI